MSPKEEHSITINVLLENMIDAPLKPVLCSIQRKKQPQNILQSWIFEVDRLIQLLAGKVNKLRKTGFQILSLCSPATKK
jgi:hypothetical protein